MPHKVSEEWLRDFRLMQGAIFTDDRAECSPSQRTGNSTVTLRNLNNTIVFTKTLELQFHDYAPSLARQHLRGVLLKEGPKELGVEYIDEMKE